MAERTGDDVAGVEECKSFTPPNVPTTSASTTRLPFGSLDLNTPRVPDTGAAITPSRRRLTESRRSVNLVTKRGRYAQRTEGQRLHDAHERRNGELGNSSRQTKMQRRRRRRLYKLSMKKRPDELVITALLYDVLNFLIGGFCLFVCWKLIFSTHLHQCCTFSVQQTTYRIGNHVYYWVWLRPDLLM